MIILLTEDRQAGILSLLLVHPVIPAILQVAAALGLLSPVTYFCKLRETLVTALRQPELFKVSPLSSDVKLLNYHQAGVFIGKFLIN